MDAWEHFLIASELASAGNFDRAEAEFAHAVLLAPAWTIARYQLGLLQFTSGRAAIALVTWAPLFDLDAPNCLAHFVRGFAALAQDDFAQAQSQFRAGLSCTIDNPALASDIEKVLARIECTHASPTTTEPEREGASSHVLVSNYGRIGNLH
jgi:tetratricopeptide (TPR) repeat protein